jgi:hypothetical protein
VRAVGSGAECAGTAIGPKAVERLFRFGFETLVGGSALNREFAMAGLTISVDRNFASKPTKAASQGGYSHPLFVVLARPGANLPEKRSVWGWFPFGEFMFGMSLIAGIAMAFNFWLSR